MLMPFIFGSHRIMKELERRIGSIARSRLPVLIEGASGTGKEALADLLHNLSGIGTGFTGRNTMGLPPVKLGRMREYIEMCRKLLRGEEVRQLASTHHEVGGYFGRLAEAGIQAVPIFAARA